MSEIVENNNPGPAGDPPSATAATKYEESVNANKVEDGQRDGDDVEGGDDVISGTAYSRKFVLQTLLELLKVLPFLSLYIVKISTKEGDDCDEDSAPAAEKVSNWMENDLCTLWDMTAEESVATVLLEFNTLSIAMSAAASTKTIDGRLTEIVAGIIGNLLSLPNIRRRIWNEDDLRHVVGLILTVSKDPPTLTEILRGFLAIVEDPTVWSLKSNQKWTEFMKDQDLLTCLLTILSSTTNARLLQYSAKTLSAVLDCHDEDHDDRYENFYRNFMTANSTSIILPCVMEGLKEAAVNDEGIVDRCETVSALIHIGSICIPYALMTKAIGETAGDKIVPEYLDGLIDAGSSCLPPSPGPSKTAEHDDWEQTDRSLLSPFHASILATSIAMLIKYYRQSSSSMQQYALSQRHQHILIDNCRRLLFGTNDVNEGTKPYRDFVQFFIDKLNSDSDDKKKTVESNQFLKRLSEICVD